LVRGLDFREYNRGDAGTRRVIPASSRLCGKKNPELLTNPGHKLY